MSINSAMSAGVSGLLANSSALAAISDNIANSNTVGYKRVASNFETMVGTQAQRTSYAAGGVAGITTQYITQQGLPQATSSSTDLAISGNGFFVVTQKAEDLKATDVRSFTRAGSFTVDSNGYLQNTAGLYLQGWPVDENGNVNNDPSDLTRLQSINVSQVGGAVEQTTRLGVNANLEASQAVSAAATAAAATPVGAGAYNASTNSMAMYDSNNTTGVKPDFSLQVPISDSKGGKRTVQIDFLKSATPNQWYAEVVSVPASAVTDGAGLSNGQISKGVVAFTADGRLDNTNTTLFSGTTPTLSFLASGTTPGAGQVAWASGDGIDAQDITLDFNNATGGLTQFDSQSVVQGINTNGTAFGNLTNIEIDDQGFVTAIFDNGVSRKIAQVAIATFPNPDGLKAISGNAYRVSQDSGSYNLKPPGAGGAGLLSSSTLESSTVDLSTEFTGLITTQRAYSASSKIITTADSMLQDLLNIIR